VLRRRQDLSPGRRKPAYLSVVALFVVGGTAGGAGPAGPIEPPRPRIAVSPALSPSRLAGSKPPGAAPKAGPRRTPVAAVPAPAAPAPAHLPVIGYWSPPRGFWPDPEPQSTAAIPLGLHPTRPLPVYDAPGGKPRALLPRSISGLPVVVPIIARRAGWVAVLLPSVNRRVGWLPTTGWVPRPLRDQLVVRRRKHELTWLRDGIPKAAWIVSVGAPATPTPLGRTFVLGRTTADGAVYAGVDALALGAVPDDRTSLSAGLRLAHTGIHSWYRSEAFGRSVSNGCIRVPKAGQHVLLKNIGPGTTVIVLD
jgi:hypothetical protein